GRRPHPRRAAGDALHRPAPAVHRGLEARHLRSAPDRGGRPGRRARQRGRAGLLMAKSERVRAAVVGAGHMGQYHTLVYAELWDVDLVGVVDTDFERARRVAAQYDTLAFSDHRELIGRVDVASVSVPTKADFRAAKGRPQERLSCAG